jgi:predicted nucleic acid-binding protein
LILLDTDVLVDVALDRSPHAGHAVDLLTFLEKSPPMAFVAWHSISNFYYLVRPIRGGDEARDFLADLTRFVTVAPTDTDALRFGAGLGLSDFEDALQVAAAYSCGVELIVTRNLKDYRRSPIPAITPSEALKRIA